MKPIWEMLPNTSCCTFRLYVPGGWLVRHVEIWYNHAAGDMSNNNEQQNLVMCFVSDPTHTWDIKDQD